MEKRATHLLRVPVVLGGQRVGNWRNRALQFILLALTLALPGGLFAQQFVQLPTSLYFTRPFGAPDPLPQVLAIGTTGAAFAFSVTPSTSTGGNWLSASPSGVGCCIAPQGITITVNTGVNGAAMAAGTYTGQVVFSGGGSITSMTVAVTLVIAPTASTFFDNTPGQLSFSMQPGGQPPPQVLQIRNAGTGTLSWTLTSFTFNSQNWLSVSSSSGTAPSVITVGIVTANLPGGGVTAGTYNGLLTIQTAGAASIITVPIGLTVAANAMPQVNALSFSKPFAGSNPLPQTVTIANDSTPAFAFSISSQTATGSTSGTWLTVSPTGVGCCVSPDKVIISPTPAITLAAGTYTGQVLVNNSTQLMVIPITLNIGAAGTAFFDDLAGQLSFFLPTGPPVITPPSQLIQIRNAGTGALNWTVTPTTFNSGNWLTVSDLNDTAPNQISVGIVVANLPGQGLTAGVFTANLLFQNPSGSSSVTVPITVQVGPSFKQVNGIDFTMLQAGPDPLPQNITIAATTTAAFAFTVDYNTATGGNWLTVSPFGGGCCVTPEALEVKVTAPPTMPAGTYTAEIVVFGGTTAMTVPVTLTVTTSANPYFDNLPGELSFSMLASSPPQTPASQIFQIRNAGSGVLNWTLMPTTSDGGAWLTVSALNGAAPAYITVGIVPANLPGGGLTAGVFVGQLLLQAPGSSTTIPVTLVVGTTGFVQINGLSFTMQQAGANPLPQVITAITPGTNFGFSLSATTATGGSWLTISPTGGGAGVTPQAVIVTVNPSPTLAAGIYTGEISFYSGTVSQTIPVTLTVAPAATPFFDNVPGGLSYALALAAGNPASQNVQIRNRGTGSLSWTAQAFTDDGGNWLTISASSGTAPSLVTIGVVTANLHNQGLVAGLFTGQVLFQAGNTSSVTIPVSVRVAGNGFVQINPINFTMPSGGANPLPQLLTVTTPGAAFEYSIYDPTGNGGSWMTVSPVGAGTGVTPDVLTVTVTAPVGLAAGTYTGEVIADEGPAAMVVPVNLTVAPATVPFFDNLQGQMSFFSPVTTPTPTTPTSQNILIEGQGAFGLNWTLTPITADTGNWLVPSALSGTAPSNITVGINVQNLPTQGLAAGLFTGQLLFQSASSTVTVPVSVKLGPPGFTQLPGLNFSMLYGAANPLSQMLSASSSGANFEYSILDSAGNGGNWLTTNVSGAGCCVTPGTITVNVNGAPSGTKVPTGVHTGQVVMNEGSFAMTVPVVLTVGGTPILSIAKSHTGNFNAGQNNALYSVTVSNQAGAGIGTTSGTVTVTETVPAGMTLQSMAGVGWTCPNQGNTCTRSDGLAAGQSYEPITVAVNVVTTTQTSLTNQVSVSGGGAIAAANASDVTAIITKCDINQAGTISVAEVQDMIDQMLGLIQAANDLNGDGVVNVADVQIIINAALNLGCQAM